LGKDMSELIGTLAGILIGFGLDRTYTGYKDRKQKQELKVNLREELKNCQDLLTGQGNLLPTVMWNSAISSGDIGLLSFADRTKLASFYFQIDNHNYEAKRVRDSAVVAQTGSRTSIVNGMPAAQAYWVTISNALVKEEESLKEKIAELLKDKTWY
jgi:hypothetical protein